jgi:cytochrome c oxidase subunit 3
MGMPFSQPAIAIDYGGRLRRARLGLAVALTPIIMLFVSFTSAYIVRQGLPTLDEHSGTYVRDWLAVNLPIAILLVNTIVLLASSISMELARRQIARRVALVGISEIPGVSVGNERAFPWLGVTAGLGIAFLTGQCFAWRELARRGFYLATSPSSSFVYVLTAAHAVHLAGGLAALLYAVSMPALYKSIESLAALWVYIFVLLAVAR